MSWGNKILISFLLFVAGMVYLVYRSMKTEFDLVEKDYYKKELVYQDVIDGTNRANQLSSAVSIQQNENGLLLTLPVEMKNKQSQGEVLFYCPSDAKKDKNIKLQVDENATQLIPVINIHPASYVVKIHWTESSHSYFVEKHITVY